MSSLVHYILVHYTQGGFNIFSEDYDNKDWTKSIQGFVGWGGFGGSMMAWHPGREVAIAYVMNGNMRTSFFGFDDPRCCRLMDALQESLQDCTPGSAEEGRGKEGQPGADKGSDTDEDEYHRNVYSPVRAAREQKQEYGKGVKAA
jgi:hypothetical protein